jgi:predicted outer membrane lipoprotein
MVESAQIQELQRDETAAERVDRNFNELLGELRIALPGVQVLFAFLLTVPFAQRFGEMSGFDRGVYFAVLLLTALACAFLIAPTAYHRLQFRQGRKEEILFFANRAAMLGLGALALAMTGAILLITDFLFGLAAAIPVGVAAAIFFGSLWYLLPLSRGRRAPRGIP